MEPVPISWLIASSFSPLVAVLTLWTLYVYHTYRRKWRTVDLFLLATCSQELLMSIFTFCFAIISLISPPFQVPCHFAQWGMAANRTFQLATLCSMVVDRALTVRWPYKYRFSVRRNHIRYHIALLAMASVLVGVGTIFAGVDYVRPNQCLLHPSNWDDRFVLFELSLYGVLMLVTLICLIQVEISRNRNPEHLKLDGSFQLPECASPDLPGMNSPLDTHSSTGSTRALHRPSRQASRRPYGKDHKGTVDLRWPSVALTCLVCFSLNHIPYVVLVATATVYPYLWSEWHEPVLCWLGLLEGFLVPLLLFLKDTSLRSALRRAFQRRSGTLSPLVGDDGPFQMYFDKDHFRKRGTFGSVTPVGIITNYRRTPGKKRKAKSGGAKYSLPGLHGADSVLPKSCFLEPLSKLSCADLTSLEMWKEEDEENFYATLSDDFSTFSCKSGDDSAPSSELHLTEEIYGGSFTTVANDDFEFHDTRPCGGEVKMKPALLTPDELQQGLSRNVSFRESFIIKRQEQIQKTCPDQTSDIFTLSDKSTSDDLKESDMCILPPAAWIDSSDSTASSPEKSPPTRDISLSTSTNSSGNMFSVQKATSYSMNDLDLLHKKLPRPSNEISSFALPVKSESTMSLYKLNTDMESQMELLSPSKSETDLNNGEDSGFGSGAQSTNPVWSGFLCRKSSDPFWNIRKPSGTPTKNYTGILHPRMRKIPWISAWKKLDEGSKNSDQNNSPWKTNLIYNHQASPNQTSNRTTSSDYANRMVSVSTIDEELSDIGSPSSNDYNLGVFARPKESGILLENAYGRIVRDDCGVQVNFFGKDVQYDVPSDKIFERSVEEVETYFSDPKARNILENQCVNTKNIVLAPQTCHNELEMDALNSSFTASQNSTEYGNIFPESSNSFNNPYQDKNENIFETNSTYSKFRNKNGALYGKLLPLNQRRAESPYKKSKVGLSRRESDNRGNRCGVRKRENRSRSEPRTDILNGNDIINFAALTQQARDPPKDKNYIEIEMKNVRPTNDLNRSRPTEKTDLVLPRHGSQNGHIQDNSAERRMSKLDEMYNQIHNGNHRVNKLNLDVVNKPKESSRERKSGLPRRDVRRDSSERKVTSVHANGIPKPVVERHESKKKTGGNFGFQPNIERKISDKTKNIYVRSEEAKKDVHKRDGRNKTSGCGKNEGLWANAIPFPKSEDVNGNSPKKTNRKDAIPIFNRSPKKSHLPRKESKNSKPNLRKKLSLNETYKLRNGQTLDVNISRKNVTNGAGAWNMPNDINDSMFEDFFRYRSKCEDNFNHIQNINREKSGDRTDRRTTVNVPQNGNIFDQFPQVSRPAVDDNENCQEKKMVVASFL